MDPGDPCSVPLQITVKLADLLQPSEERPRLTCSPPASPAHRPLPAPWGTAEPQPRGRSLPGPPPLHPASRLLRPLSRRLSGQGPPRTQRNSDDCCPPTLSLAASPPSRSPVLGVPASLRGNDRASARMDSAEAMSGQRRPEPLVRRKAGLPLALVAPESGTRTTFPRSPRAASRRDSGPYVTDAVLRGGAAARDPEYARGARKVREWSSRGRGRA